MKIVITGGCSAKAFKLLKAFPLGEIILTDYGEVPQSGGVNAIVSLGELNQDTIAHNLLNFCLDQGATMLVPLNTFEISALVKATALFEEFDIKLMLPDITEVDQYLSNNTNQIKEFIVLEDGMQLYPPIFVEHRHTLSGVFYIDAQGVPLKLFTLD